MYNIDQPQPFALLKEYFLPAIHHPILVGKKKMYNLSIPLEGNEIQVKRSSKKIVHTSYAKVILGAVMRMQKLFQPDKLQLGVLITKRPTTNDLTLEFELVNSIRFKLGEEDYFVSIVARYSYSKPEFVTYYPIIYRQWCTNGAVSILSEQFKEVIPVESILDITCEWTRCNFETYKNQANNYFESLKRSPVIQNFMHSEADGFIETILGIKRKRHNDFEYPEAKINRDTRNIDSIYRSNVEQLGENQFALFNTLTAYASLEPNLDLRYQYFMAIGKYLAKEMRKTIKMNREYWSESLDWNGLVKLSS